MEMNQNEAPLGRRLKRAAHMWRAFWGQQLDPLEIHPRQARVLKVLDTDQLITQANLGEALGVDRSSMVALCDSLEDQGWMQREVHPDDRRAYALALTDAGREMLVKVQELTHSAESEFLDPLGAHEVATMRAVLDKLDARHGHLELFGREGRRGRGGRRCHPGRHGMGGGEGRGSRGRGSRRRGGEPQG